MRILLVTGEFPPMQGGVGDYTRELGLALHGLGSDVQVLTSKQARPMAGMTIHPLVERWNWSSWGTVLGLVRQQQPDVLHIQYQAAAYGMHPAINLLPRRLGRFGDERPRTVVTFHDLRVPYLFPKAGPVRRWVVDELAHQCDAAITTNREDFENLRPRLDTAPTLIPIGSNIKPELPVGYVREAWRARWGAGPGDLLLCFFGFVNDRKGVDTLLETLALLVSDSNHQINPLLLFIGGQTGASDPTNVAYLAQMQALVAELSLEDRVCWTGYIPAEEVTASFDAADLCVLPYRDGASFLHGTFHAALAHGIPVLTTQPRVPLPELVEGDNVLLVPPEQPEALAETITRLAGAPDLCRALAEGAKVLSAQFRWEAIAADTLALYQRIGASA